MQDWDDGYINQDSSGRRVFYIRKQFAGKRHHFSLQTGDLEIALREYRRGRATTTAVLRQARSTAEGADVEMSSTRCMDLRAC